MENDTLSSDDDSIGQEKPKEQKGVLDLVSRWLRSQLGGKHQDASLKEALEEVLEEHEDETERLAPEEKNMIRNMLSFGEVTVRDIMVQRTDIVALPHDSSFEDVKKHVIEQRHTRMPVYRETMDDIIGILHIKDLVPMFCGDQSFDMQQALRPAFFVPPSMKIIDLLMKMRVSGEHMAMVVDEYGGTDGLVTMENLIEELVGDIQDEHDEAEPIEDIIWVSENVADADARLRIDRLEEELGFEVASDEEEDDFDTLGGLIFFYLGRVPAKGEIIDHPSGIKLEILEADPRRVRRVRIVRHAMQRTPEPV